MIHEKTNVTGKILVEFEAEDWVWWCRFLAELLKSPEQDDWSREDLAVIERTIRSAEAGVAVNGRS